MLVVLVKFPNKSISSVQILDLSFAMELILFELSQVELVLQRHFKFTLPGHVFFPVELALELSVLPEVQSAFSNFAILRKLSNVLNLGGAEALLAFSRF